MTDPELQKEEADKLGVVITREAFLWTGPKSHKPKEVLSQALYGCILGILDEREDRLFVRMPDRYTGWVDRSRVMRLNKHEMGAFRGEGMVLLKSREARLEATEQGQDEDFWIPYGTFLPKDHEEGGKVLVRSPDGRLGALSKDDVVAGDTLGWAAKNKGTVHQILRDVEMLRTVAYTWGGTSSQTGFDCSGLIQTVFRVHGYPLPRDAAQQYLMGRNVEIRSLRPGDLLFFKDPEVSKKSVTHVGVALGPDGFADAGNHWPTSLTPSSPYFSEKRARQFVGARRVF